MADETNKGKMWLFTNSYRKEEKHPVLTGNGEIHADFLKEMVAWYNENKPSDGIIKFQAATWDRVAKSGKPFTFVSFELKKERTNASIPNPDGSVSEASEDEDIPF